MRLLTCIRGIGVRASTFAIVQGRSCEQMHLFVPFDNRTILIISAGHMDAATSLEVLFPFRVDVMLSQSWKCDGKLR